jgi:hypothetical protein
MNLPESRSVVIFFLIGGLLLLVAFLLGDPTKRGEFGVDVLKNIALIVLTVVVVEVLWSLTGNEPVRKAVGDLQETLAELRQSVQLLDDSRKSGLQRVYAASGAAGSHEQWMEHLRDATHSVDLMGYTLHVWTKGANFEETLTHLVASGVHIRILIMDETNRHLDAFINHHQIPGLTPDSVRAELKAARDAFRSVLESISAIDATGTLKLRVLKKGLIVTQIARMDDRITAVQYLYHAVASRTPLLEVFGDKSALFQCYKEEFDSMWKLAENK